MLDLSPSAPGLGFDALAAIRALGFGLRHLQTHLPEVVLADLALKPFDLLLLELLVQAVRQVTVAAALDHLRFVAPAQHVTPALMTVIEPDGGCALQL